jgi:hypothetical protein
MQETRVITYKPRWFQNQKLILGTVAVSVFWQLLASQLKLTGLISLILAVQLVLFVFLFHRPIWAMAALIVGQLTASNYMITLGDTQISIRLMWTVLAIILLIPIIKARGGIKLGGQARRVLIPSIIFFCLATVSNAVNVDMSYTMQYLRTGFTSLSYFSCLLS